MATDDIRKIVYKIADDRNGVGWWTDDGEETFNELGLKLYQKGFNLEEVEQILDSAYSAVASEFGN